MLSAEQASERLKAFENPQHQQDLLKRVLSLRGKLSLVGQILIEAGPTWVRVANDRPKVIEARRDAFDRLGKFKTTELEKLIRVLFPKLAPEVSEAWRLFDILPYQTTYHRRPFRKPIESSVVARATWLTRLVFATRGYDQDVNWFAVWAPYLGYGAPDALGYLFAGAIETGGKNGQEVFDLLIASANGSHEIGAMGRHVVRGLLCSSRQDGWEFIERMLLAAQREEGLRQVILESVDEAHPQAFRRLFDLILEHNLIRFSAVIRALDVWFGLAFETVTQKKVNEILSRVRHFLNNPLEAERVTRGGSAQDAYYALWAMAFEDVMAALPHAIELRQSADVERRFVATHLLAQMDLVGSFNGLLEALEDEDLRVAARAAVDLVYLNYRRDLMTESDLFERLERLVARLSHKQNTFKPLVWEWLTIRLDRERVAGMLIESLGSRSPDRLIPYLTMMSPRDRSRVATLLKQRHLKDPETRQVLLSLVSDRSPQVRESALDAIKEFKLAGPEVRQLEDLLSRKAQDLRRGIIKLLLNLPDRKLVKSIRRLLDQNNAGQRRAGLELIRECTMAGRRKAECLRLASELENKIELTRDEVRILEDILAEKSEHATLEDALGLMDPKNRTKPTPPPSEARLFGILKKVKLGSPAAAACLKSLDELVDLHRTESIEMTQFDVPKTELLGNIRWGFPKPDPTQPPNLDQRRLPLFEVWENWWSARSKELRDTDGYELVRALAVSHLFKPRWIADMQFVAEAAGEYQKSFDIKLDFELKYESIVQAVLEWLIWIHPAKGEVDFILDTVEASVSRIPSVELTGATDNHYSGFSRAIPHERLTYLSIARWLRTIRPETWKCEHHQRFWHVVRWIDQPKPDLPRQFPELEDILFAYQCDAATRDDLLDLLLGPRLHSQYGRNFHQLRELTGRRPHPFIVQHPILRELVDHCRERILSIETRRGDLPTAATIPALNLGSIPGQQNLFRLLAAMRDLKFERGYIYGQSRSAVLSHLIRNSYPLESDTYEDFAALAQQLKISERRLVELAVYAPQWAAFVESTLGWPELSQAVWWVYAHTKDRHWSVGQDLREEWGLRISEHTSLSADSLMDGAVDVAWFRRVYSALGVARWKLVDNAALYAAGGKGHTRARLFADVMLGKVTSEELTDRINKKRHQDSVRALGLVPLPKGEEDHQEKVLRRFEVMQEFLRTSKKFGSQRQASEKLAVAIGMENLARTAGYIDPQRLEWAMEIESVADLADGPVVVEVDETRVSLTINYLGEPKITVIKKAKILKSIPRRIKKDERIVSLLQRKRQFDRQVSRMRLSLEQAMIRGDIFTGAEITHLFRHPMLRAMLEQLIFVNESGMGYPVSGGHALLTHTGDLITLAYEDELWIAHPWDLLDSGQWHLWQHDCFEAERIQPFKQVFRELYPLTETEKTEGNQTHRYAGHQLNPRQALALFGSRGWVTDPEYGVYKTFHDLGISARVGFAQGMFTPAEVEGLTIDVVAFTKRGEWASIPLEKIAPRIFSEVMRDLDLVVSVAHTGGVDPETSASSIEAREALVRETCRLLDIGNVQVKDRHAIIEGKLGNYTIHLGSAVVHKQPGGSVCIIPVHSQHRGRLFLPFVDNDPRSAEVISKVVLLANDKDIRDPTILEQLLN